MPDSIEIRKPPPETAIARPEESAVIPENLAVMPIRETVLFPARSEDYMHVHRESGFEFIEHKGSFAGGAFDPGEASGSILVFRRL